MGSFTLDGYDHAKEVKEFDDSKVGVKGLVDAGVTTIPRIFHHPRSSVTVPRATTAPSLSIPTVDLSLPRHLAVQLVSAAARDWGFFQVTNHGLPPDAISAALSAVQAFNELPTETKAAHYTREVGGVSFSSNYDLYRSDAASWLDSLVMATGPTPPDATRIPDVCRQELLTWDEHARELAVRVMALLSEGLGLEAGRLEELSYLEQRTMACNYYPYCPQPELTLGLARHTDGGILTVLVQNELEGLLVWKEDAAEGGGEWFMVEPIPGTVVINVGDTLQMISNDEYKSGEHMVVANPYKKPRVSIAIFYSPNQRDESTYFGPLKDLVSKEKPARYREFTMPEVMNTVYSTKIGARCILNHFKV